MPLPRLFSSSEYAGNVSKTYFCEHRNTKGFSVFIISLCMPLRNCTNKNKSEIKLKQEQEPLDTVVSYPLTINLLEAINNIDDSIHLSTFGESIEYIPLKLGDNYLRDIIQSVV